MGEVWIGLAELARGEGCEFDIDGVAAFAWWVTQANSEAGFLRKVSGALEYYKVILLGIEEIRRYEENDDVLEEVHEMAERVMENENWVLFGTFFSYPNHNA